MTPETDIADLFPIGAHFDGVITNGLPVHGTITGHGEFRLALAKDDDGLPAYVSWDALRAAVRTYNATFRVEPA